MIRRIRLILIMLPVGGVSDGDNRGRRPLPQSISRTDINRLILILFAVVGLTLNLFAPLPSEVAAQNVDSRGNGDGDDVDSRRDGRAQRGRRGSPNNNDSTRPAGKAASGNLNMDNYVRGLVRQNDKNGDMMLQADEQRSLSGKAATADVDKDGVITVNELATTLTAGTPAPAASTSDSTDRRGDSAGDDRRGRRSAFDNSRRGRDRDGGNVDQALGSAGESKSTRIYTSLGAVGGSATTVDKRRTYRFTPGANRLPTGLPSWFKSRDKNGDGQVAMSEYSRSWSDRTVGDFRRYDLNDDGMITSKEATRK